MRLINVHTLELKTFGHSDIPLYAALSHRWSGNEIEYGDFINPESRNGTGFEKIRNACREVRAWYWDFERRLSNGYVKQHRGELVDWVWVDTCCIDKRNFTEYTEAINSMWNWYRRAAFCIVYLADVKYFEHRYDTLAALRQSEWFERGWTLQELLAPRTLFFYSNEWQQIGSSGESDLMDTIARASTIPARYLGNRKKKITAVSVAQRMSWAAQRTTTRPEDLAYCLIGIFDVNMTTMYGEGFGKAFQRLQRMILDRCDDESIFAFTPRKGQDGVLATSPREFAGCGNIIKCTRQERSAYSVCNRGLQFCSPAIDVGASFGSALPRRRYAIELNCARTSRGRTGPVMCTLGLKKKGSRFIRDPEIEIKYDAASEARVEKNLDKRIWTWTPSQRFYIHISKSGRSRRRRETVEELETVTDVFSKAINWLARHCPFQALGLRAGPYDRDIREGRSMLVKRGPLRGASISLHDQDHRHGRTVSTRQYRFDSRSRRAPHSHSRHSQTGGSSCTPRRHRRPPERRIERSLSRGRPTPWTTDTSFDISGFPLRQQWRDYHSVCESCRRPLHNQGPRRDREDQPDGRPSRSRLRSSIPTHRGDSGYGSTHSRRDAGAHLAYGDSDSGLSS